MAEADDAVSLAAELIRVEARLDEMVQNVAALTENVDVLVEAHAHASAARRQRAWWWPDLDTDAGAQRLAVLTAWVDAGLLARSPEDRRRVRPCWYLHPAAVDELTVLYAAWFNAYRDPRGTPSAALEYHDRWKPNGLKRVGEILASCARSHSA
jgi:hypothetical protein